MKTLARKIKTVWQRLNRSQRRALALLGMINLIVLGILALLLLRPPMAQIALLQSPLAASQVETCRQSVSRALLQRGSSGLVQALADGSLLIQLERPTANPGPSVGTGSNHLRSAADAAVWLAFEALSGAGRDACQGFRTVHVTVVIQIADSQPVRVTARAALSDVLTWSQGRFDDAELARRVEYHAPDASP